MEDKILEVRKLSLNCAIDLIESGRIVANSLQDIIQAAKDLDDYFNGSYLPTLFNEIKEKQ
jgi:hypothetical protein